MFLGIEPASGGSFQYNQTMLEAMSSLPADEYEVVIGYSHETWKPYLKDLRCCVIRIPFGFWGRIWAQLIRYSHINLAVWRRIAVFFHPTVKAFATSGCHLWIFPSQDPWGYLATAPSLVSVHDLMHRYEKRFPEVASPREYAWREWHYRNICRCSAGILVDSNVGRKQVVDSYGVDESRVHVLPFIAPSYIHQSDAAEEAMLSRYAIPVKYIFYPAQFWEHKNHKRLLRAIAQLKSSLVDIRLVLTGAPKNAYASTMKLVHELNLSDQVIIIGYVPDDAIPVLYKHARALIMPTFFGPTNIPPLEAMTVGCPVAVSNIYGMPEQTAGAALLFDPESVSDIVRVIERLWHDDALCRQLSQMGQKVISQWTKEDFAFRLKEILTDVFEDSYRKSL